MKISEFIRMLEGAKDKHGDIEVWTSHEWLSPVENKYEHSQEQNLDNYPNYFPEMIVLEIYGQYSHREEWEKRRK